MKILKRIRKNEEQKILDSLKKGDKERFELFQSCEFLKTQIKKDRLYPLFLTIDSSIGVWFDGKDLWTNKNSKNEKLLFMKNIKEAMGIIEGVVNYGIFKG